MSGIKGSKQWFKEQAQTVAATLMRPCVARVTLRYHLPYTAFFFTSNAISETPKSEEKKNVEILSEEGLHMNTSPNYCHLDGFNLVFISLFSQILCSPGQK